MHAASFRFAFASALRKRTCGDNQGFLTLSLATMLSLGEILVAPLVVLAEPSVQFDIARAVECRDVTPRERIAQYPMQRLIEVALPVSVRFQDVSRDDVDEIDIEVSGAMAGLRVQDFAPRTQLASEITREIETTTTTKKMRSLEGTLGGSLPIPGAEAAARLTPSISAGLSGCETATEKINRLPPKHVVVVCGTTAEGRGVFFKLKRTSQTSLEGVHELAVTFVAPRTWPAIAIKVECKALGERKTLWMKQETTLGHLDRYVQLMPAAPAPTRQVVLKPIEAGLPAATATAVANSSAASPTKWRPARATPLPAKRTDNAALALLKKVANEANSDGTVEVESAETAVGMD
jgi:hypothetical protein